MPVHQVRLTEEQEAFIAAQVKDGRYPSIEAALRDGLRALQLIENDNEMKLRRFYAEIQVGLDELDRGEGTVVRLEDIDDYLSSLGETATKEWPGK